MKHIFLFLIAGVFSVSGWAVSTHAEGFLRDKIKDRIIEKIESKPAPESNASITDKIVRQGDYYFSISHGGLDRFYRVHVPPSYRPMTPAPVVFAFHGGGGDMDYMANDKYYGLISKSDKEGFVVVFPNGYSRLKSGKLATWNAGNCCGDARDQKIDDVGFVRQIITNIEGQMNIDRNRIFATGMSNGGMMSHRLACDMADVFRAVASVAGTDNTQECHPTRSIAVMNIHAMNDEHVLFNGGAGAGAFKDESKVTQFTSVPETVARWVSRNHCKDNARRVLDVSSSRKSGRAYCDIYDSCANGVAVKLCVTEGGGHSWPGGYKPRLRGEDPSEAISANDEIWKFFKDLK